MLNRLEFLLNRLRERLWVKPLFVCVISIAAAFLARMADDSGLGDLAPEISRESIQTLLTIISSSMMVIATFAVASMVTAYASASNTATPRTFSVVIADDVSQNALSAFIGAFIFSIVALIALLNGYYGTGGRFALFALTLIVFAVVIFTFVRWVDRIARLGRLGSTIDKVEAAAAKALERRRQKPLLGGSRIESTDMSGWMPVCSSKVGYIQGVNVDELQSCASKMKLRITVGALPGTFLFPNRPLAWYQADSEDAADTDSELIGGAFLIEDERLFDEDPRFGLIVLSEIASRALSPAVNDPGTAIDIIGTQVRLLVNWSKPLQEEEISENRCDRVFVPELRVTELFEDAFSAVARDGAGLMEVVCRLLKALESLANCEDGNMASAARDQARRAVKLAEKAMQLPQDLEVVRALGKFAE